MFKLRSRKGSVMIVVLGIFILLVGFAFAVYYNSSNNLKEAKHQEKQL